MRKKVAIQGFSGSYSEEAVEKMLHDDFEVLSFFNFEDAFRSVLCGEADCGVFPIQNKIVGNINQTISLIEKTGLKVYEQLKLRIEHVLVGTPNSELEQVKFVHSQKEALLQCKGFFLRNPRLKQVESSDTALSVKEIMQRGLPENAAIASRRAVLAYEARILCEDIADDPENWTLFCLVGR
ncbi:MAG: hypothetical protein KatS3mg006_0214 [Pyrinomonadaceae bacterium]|jgi:prephenate dehydratase|nr:MAG: hypothetical protein KatS3mg006_0214 [Pyrinomonadaceae bacterium]